MLMQFQCSDRFNCKLRLYINVYIVLLIYKFSYIDTYIYKNAISGNILIYIV